MRARTQLIAALCLAFAALEAGAQQDLQPAVQTSPAAAAAKPGTINSSSPSPAKAAPAPAAKPAAGAPAAAKAPAPAPASASAPARKSSDRIELDTTQISGNRELPKVM